MQPRLFESRGVLEFVDVGDKDKAKRRVGARLVLARAKREPPKVARDDRRQLVTSGIIKVRPSFRTA